MRRPAASVLSLLFVCFPLLGQDKPHQDAFTERVEVKVRTIVAIVTDAGAKHLVSPPSEADLEVLEDGEPAEIVGIELVSLGFVVVPVTNGAPPTFEFEGSAQQNGAIKSSDNRRTYQGAESLASAVRRIPLAPASLAWQPTDPLYNIAEATGGEVAIGAGHLRKALERFDDAYAISYKSRTAGQRGVRSLEVRARRPGFVVRAARATAGGSFAAEILAHGRAAAALEAANPEGPLSIVLRIQGCRKAGKGLTAGTLLVTTDLAPAAGALTKVGAARARVTLAVETDDPTPFLTSQETNVDQSGEGSLWTYEVPMTWPKEARRVSVLVEELKTGLFGSASVDLPR